MRRSRFYYPEYVPVAEKKAKAAKALDRLRKSKGNLQPVILAGKALAGNWWGKGWNINLERYADYSNRIGRGRSYVRHGAVLDLAIEAGEIRALVQGSRRNPYEVRITIRKIKNDRWTAIKRQCQGKIEALPDLLAGRFPAELADIFMAEGAGLFPTPKEINFQCSCPDWAYMCKHVAATLYGIGARLDEDPTLLFKLRQVEMTELISGALRESSDRILARSASKSHRVMEESDLGALFGIDLAEPSPLPAPLPAQPLAKNSAAAAPDNTPTSKPRPKTRKPTATAKTTPRKLSPSKARPRATPKPGAKKKAGSPLFSKQELCSMLRKMLRKNGGG